MSEEGYTYAEKLAAVAQGLMDPKEIGLTTSEEAQQKVVTDMSADEQVLHLKLGTTMEYKAAVVPIELRARWAISELKVQPKDGDVPLWIASWIQEHKDDHLIQAKANCGAVGMVMELLAKDPILGIIGMMRKAADALEKRYAEQIRLEREAAAKSNEAEQSPERTVEG